ncbi:MAG: ABC transporter substrate-binding protein [Proteobacteria bacterium]|nr:ABC transporter substrate-binding protein [Pseudomonadota bacterium]
MEPFDLAFEFSHELNADVGGHFKAQGLDVQITNVRGTSIAIQQVVAKQAQVTRVGALDLMKAVAAQGVPLVSIATSLHEGIFSLVSLKSAPLKTPADMKGKTIGVASIGGGQENTLDLLLVSSGVPVAEVPRQAIGSSAGNIELLKQGRVNGFFATVETSLIFRRANEPVEIVSAAKFAPMPGGAIVVRRDFAAENPDVAVRFLRAMRASAEELLTADPNMIIERIEKKYEISADKDRNFRIEALKAYNNMALSQGRENLLKNVPGVWRKAAELTSKAGIVKVADGDALYANQYIDQAYK